MQHTSLYRLSAAWRHPANTLGRSASQSAARQQLSRQRGKGRKRFAHAGRKQGCHAGRLRRRKEERVGGGHQHRLQLGSDGKMHMEREGKPCHYEEKRVGGGRQHGLRTDRMESCSLEMGDMKQS